MNTQSVFQFITEVTQKENVSCVVIGGFAINHYKVSRQTMDVDFLITEKDFNKIYSALEKAGYKQVARPDNFVQLKSTRLSLMDIDFMFVEQETLDKILKESELLEIAGQNFKVPSLYHLIALKLHSIKCNPKIRLLTDLPDVVNLIRVNAVNVEDTQFKELCLKFGTEEIYQRIMEFFK